MSEYQYYEFVAIDAEADDGTARSFVTREHYSDQLRQ